MLWRKCARRAIADLPVYAETCPRYLLYLSLENMDAAGDLKEPRYCVYAAVAGEVESGEIEERIEAQCMLSGIFHQSLSILF